MKKTAQALPQEITKQRIIDDLKKIGVEKGDHLAVTLSLKSVGHVIGGPKTFIEALLEVVGPNGTVMMNTHTRGFPSSEIAHDHVFDYESTPCWTGVVPETLRKWQNAIRSKNPLCSVAAVGKLAQHLTTGHDEHANLFEPYSRLAAVSGKYLAVGLRDNLVAIRHEAQRLAGLNNVVKMFWGTKYVNDHGTVRVYASNRPPCSRNLPSLVPRLKSSGILKTGKIGSADAYLASAKQLLDSMKEMLALNPRLTLCKDLSCLWCREAEKNLNLHTNIKGGKGIKTNLLAVTILRFANTFRLRRYLFLSLQRRQRNQKPQQPRRKMFSNFLDLCYLTVVDLLK